MSWSYFCHNTDTQLYVPYDETCAWDNSVNNPQEHYVSPADNLGDGFIADNGSGTILFAPYGNNNGFDADKFEIWKSTDYGVTWSNTDAASSIGNIGGFYTNWDEVSHLSYAGDYWWVVVWNSPDKIGRKYYSTDGENWTAINSNFPLDGFNYHSDLVRLGTDTAYWEGLGGSNIRAFGSATPPATSQSYVAASRAPLENQFYTRTGTKLGDHFYWLRSQEHNYIPEITRNSGTNGAQQVVGVQDNVGNGFIYMTGTTTRISGFSPVFQRSGLDTAALIKNTNNGDTLEFFLINENFIPSDDMEPDLIVATMDCSTETDQPMFCGWCIDHRGKLMVAYSDWVDNTKDLWIRTSSDGMVTWSDAVKIDWPCTRGIGTDKATIGSTSGINEQNFRALKYLGNKTYCFAYKEAQTAYPGLITFKLS